MHAKINLKNSIKGILYDFEKKMKKLIFQFFDENLLSAWFKDENLLSVWFKDENLLSAWFKDERPQG